MAPYYQGYDPNFKLNTDDIKGIQALYGTISIVNQPEFQTSRVKIQNRNNQKLKSLQKPKLVESEYVNIFIRKKNGET